MIGKDVGTHYKPCNLGWLINMNEVTKRSSKSPNLICSDGDDGCLAHSFSSLVVAKLNKTQLCKKKKKLINRYMSTFIKC